MTERGTPAPRERSGWLELFLLSFASLYLELFVIRWMSADMRPFSIFRTFPLVTCFVGLGVGFALGRDRYFRLLPLALCIFALLMKSPDLLGISDWMTFPSEAVFSDWNSVRLLSDRVGLYLLFFMPFLVLVLSGPFAVMVTLGCRLGVLFNQIRPLVAYSINITGAIAGSVTFSVLCFLGLSPWQLMLLPALIICAYCCRPGGWARYSALPAAVAVAVAAWYMPLAANFDFGSAGGLAVPPAWQQVYWSPYQRLDVVETRFIAPAEGKPVVIPVGVTIMSNRAVHQTALDLSSSTFDAERYPDFKRILNEFGRRYYIPFLLKQADDVLVVGAGSGTDVAEALRKGAKSVDAVDIDPVILNLGRLYNPRRPYSDPRARPVCDDARSFFNKCTRQYDLIIFSDLDSHVVTGQGASVRLENYVYTRESFQRAYRLLKPDGLMVVAFCTVKDWLRDRLFVTMKDAIGYAPLVVEDKRSTFLVPTTVFIAGKAVREHQVRLPEAEKDVFSSDDDYKPADERILSDDWPFLYVLPTAVDIPYLLVVFEVLVLALYAGRRFLFAPADSRTWQLFFMGGAFLLLELQAISRLALIYGSTWLTSAVVINGVLVMILLANLLVVRFGSGLGKSEHPYFALLMLALAASYFVPVDWLLSAFGSGGQLAVVAITVLPMFLAGIIFARAFAVTPDPARALAFNLIGSVVGAMLEYLSNYWGVRSLVLVAAVLYACAWYFAARTPGPTAGNSCQS